MKAIKLRYKILLGLVACHFALVICGAFSFRIPGKNPVSAALRGYSAASGAENGYGFFAPGVGSQFRFTFTMTDAEGNTWTDTMRFGTSQEANLRLTGMANYLSQSNAGHRYLVMQSLAGKMFARHPKANKVTVQYQMWGMVKPAIDPEAGPVVNLPRMHETRAGAKANWLTFEMYAFTRGKKSADNAPFRFTFTMTDADGKSWNAGLSLNEAEVVLDDPEYDGADMSNEKDRLRVLKALALVMFDRYAKAKKVTTRYEAFYSNLQIANLKPEAKAKLPAGVKAGWNVMQEDTFVPAE